MNNKNITLTIHDIAKVKSNDLTINEKIEIIKCSVTLKGIKSAIRPLMEGWAVPSDNPNGALEDFIDEIAHFYRDNYNNDKPVNTTITHDESGLSLKMINNPNETAYPTGDDYLDQVREDADFMLKIDDKGLCISYKSGYIDPNSKRVRNQAGMIYNSIDKSMWAGKHENGAEDYWVQMRNGIITRDECNAGLQKVFNNEIKAHMKPLVKDINGLRKRSNTPIELKYTEIERTY